MPGVCGPIQGWSHFATAEPNTQSRQSKSLEDREIGKQFVPLWKVVAEKLKVLFPEGDDTGTFNVPPLQCSNLLHLETDSCLILLLLACVFLVFLKVSCNRSSLKPAIWLRIALPMCDGHPFASSLFRRLAGGGPFFCVFPFRWALQFALSLARCLTLTGRSTLL